MRQREINKRGEGRKDIKGDGKKKSCVQERDIERCKKWGVQEIDKDKWKKEGSAGKR